MEMFQAAWQLQENKSDQKTEAERTGTPEDIAEVTSVNQLLNCPHGKQNDESFLLIEIFLLLAIKGLFCWVSSHWSYWFWIQGDSVFSFGAVSMQGVRI